MIHSAAGRARCSFPQPTLVRFWCRTFQPSLTLCGMCSPIAWKTCVRLWLFHLSSYRRCLGAYWYVEAIGLPSTSLLLLIMVGSGRFLGFHPWSQIGPLLTLCSYSRTMGMVEKKVRALPKWAQCSASMTGA